MEENNINNEEILIEIDYQLKKSDLYIVNDKVLLKKFFKRARISAITFLILSILVYILFFLDGSLIYIISASIMLFTAIFCFIVPALVKRNVRKLNSKLNVVNYHYKFYNEYYFVKAQSDTFNAEEKVTYNLITNYIHKEGYLILVKENRGGYYIIPDNDNIDKLVELIKSKNIKEK